MELFFADDSTHKGVRDGMGKIISFGGVFVSPEALMPLEQQITDICQKKYAIPEGEEIKWSPKKKSWIYENLHGEKRTECYREIIQAALDHGVKAIVICWDEGRTTLKGERAFNKALDFAFERISVHLEKQDTIGLMIADRPGGSHKQDEAFLSDFLERVNNGTVHVGPDRVALNILTTPSHLVKHLQLADLVTSITAAMVAGHDRYAGELFPLVKKMFISNHFGYIGGSGLKLFPDDLWNLYHWVLGEDAYVKVSMSGGIGLPHKGLPYAENP